MKWQIEGGGLGMLRVRDLDTGELVENVTAIAVESDARDGHATVRMEFRISAGSWLQVAPWRELPPIEIRDAS